MTIQNIRWFLVLPCSSIGRVVAFSVIRKVCGSGEFGTECDIWEGYSIEGDSQMPPFGPLYCVGRPIKGGDKMKKKYGLTVHADSMYACIQLGHVYSMYTVRASHTTPAPTDRLSHLLLYILHFVFDCHL